MIASIVPAVIDYLRTVHAYPPAFHSFALFLLPVAVHSVALVAIFAIGLLSLPYAIRIVRLSVVPSIITYSAYMFGIFVAIQVTSLWILVIVLPLTPVLLSALYVVADRLNASQYLCRLSFRISVAILTIQIVLLVSTWIVDFPGRSLGFQRPWLFPAVFVVLAFILWIPALRVSVRSKTGLAATLTLFIISLGSARTLVRARPVVRPFNEPVVSESRPLHVVLLTIDTLRTDAISSLSDNRVSTPHIDNLAQDSVQFLNAISPAPWTLPSIVSLMTGQSVATHGIGVPEHSDAFFPTIGNYLLSHGYKTKAIIGNSLLDFNRNIRMIRSGAYPNDASSSFFDAMPSGFEEYDVYGGNRYGRSAGARMLEGILGYSLERGGTTTELVDIARAWLSRNLRSRFFMWLHLYDPHGPYAPPVGFTSDTPDGIQAIPYADVNLFSNTADYVRIRSRRERQWTRSLYDDEVRYVDYSVGRLLSFMKEQNIYDDALIILTSDHGEEFWEHGSVEHGHTLYNELLEVPLLVKLPRSSVTRRVTARVPTVALVPTLLDLLSVDDVDRSGMAESLIPLCRNDTPDSYGSSILTTGTNRFENLEAVMFRRFKYIRTKDGANEELFDLDDDASERRSILASHPHLVSEARDILLAARQESEVLRRGRVVDENLQNQLDDELRRRLRSLGYIK